MAYNQDIHGSGCMTNLPVTMDTPAQLNLPAIHQQGASFY